MFFHRNYPPVSLISLVCHEAAAKPTASLVPCLAAFRPPFAHLTRLIGGNYTFSNVLKRANSVGPFFLQHPFIRSWNDRHSNFPPPLSLVARFRSINNPSHYLFPTPCSHEQCSVLRTSMEYCICIRFAICMTSFLALCLCLHYYAFQTRRLQLPPSLAENQE